MRDKSQTKQKCSTVEQKSGHAFVFIYCLKKVIVQFYPININLDPGIRPYFRPDTGVLAGHLGFVRIPGFWPDPGSGSSDSVSGGRESSTPFFFHANEFHAYILNGYLDGRPNLT